jgi:CheY-like chemotaxis protein
VEVRSSGDGRVEIEVADTGVGMDPALIGRLFQPFVQAGAAVDPSRSGLGLGLALAKGLVELHGGTIAARSAGSGLGSTFVVALPAAEPVETVQADPRRPGAPAKALGILIIEDNLDAALSLRLLLEHLGHRVATAHSGQEGLALARARRPEVVLCDIGLPDLDGYQVARILRADPSFGPARLFAMTGYGQDEDKRKALEAGFDRHLTKPADPEVLVQLLTVTSEVA